MWLPQFKEVGCYRLLAETSFKVEITCAWLQPLAETRPLNCRLQVLNVATSFLR
jgi:hypothetical protein